ncbi:lycopene cyclase domain-containing protein [Myceligenerans salitolerans]|uniref:Lycopene cyclase domain-containing protein n=1 Tax=Myceligenerans salitolerans TaxID=1230528 RepID=A0ABS3I606_9MICO|nr:lycopene cyclase domain-containing protein [Myceligenerans salitolerans]MBO0607814.1 lycopene cyclase domain-containing protein [Myceligenerans salitolerans]
MSFAYLAVLLVSAGFVLLLDARFRLFCWHAPARAAGVLLIGTAFFLAWDLAGISFGVFFHGGTSYMTGVMLAPELPLEELVFLLFLCELTMVLVLGAGRVLHRVAARSEVRREDLAR